MEFSKERLEILRISEDIGKIAYNGKWYSHVKTNTYSHLKEVIDELVDWKPSTIQEFPNMPQADNRNK